MEYNDAQAHQSELNMFSDLLADFCVVLLANGASSNRTDRNVQRIAKALDYQAYIFYSFSSVVLTVSKKGLPGRTTTVRNIAGYGANFSIVSAISVLSWQIHDEKTDPEIIRRKLSRIKRYRSYPEWMVWLFIGLASAALCRIFDGNALECLVTFIAGFAGIYARRILLKRKYNIFISWLFGAFISVTVVNISQLLGMQDVKAALTACVLWLIPGVPLINGFLDMLEGHIVSGFAKAMYGTMLIFMIAIGFYLSLEIFGHGLSS